MQSVLWSLWNYILCNKVLSSVTHWLSHWLNPCIIATNCAKIYLSWLTKYWLGSISLVSCHSVWYPCLECDCFNLRKSDESIYTGVWSISEYRNQASLISHIVISTWSNVFRVLKQYYRAELRNWSLVGSWTRALPTQQPVGLCFEPVALCRSMYDVQGIPIL